MYHCLSFASSMSMTLRLEYLTKEYLIFSLKYYMTVRYYVCYTQIC